MSFFLKECRATFDMFDKNGNGTINAQELFSVMRSLGIKSSLKEAQVSISVMLKSLDILYYKAHDILHNKSKSYLLLIKLQVINIALPLFRFYE